jgi:hypothetical protein
MPCDECGTTARTDRHAVAVCSRCGAATCADHVRELTDQVAASSVGNPVVRTVRRLRCSTCALHP